MVIPVSAALPSDREPGFHAAPSPEAAKEPWFGPRPLPGEGARLTPIRRRVLEVLLGSAKPLGAYDLADALASHGRRLAPITVYRALDFLIEQGLAYRLASRNAYIVGSGSQEDDGLPRSARPAGTRPRSRRPDVADTVLKVLKEQGYQPRARILEDHGTLRPLPGRSLRAGRTRFIKPRLTKALASTKRRQPGAAGRGWHMSFISSRAEIPSESLAGPAPRHRTVGVRVGSVMVGGGAPIVVQSMTSFGYGGRGCDRGPGRGARPGGLGDRAHHRRPRRGGCGRAEDPRAARPGSAWTCRSSAIFIISATSFSPITRPAPALAKCRIQSRQCGLQGEEGPAVRRDRRTGDQARQAVRIGANWGSLDQELLTHLMNENAASAHPRDMRWVTREAMISRPSPLGGPRRGDPGSGATGSSCRRRSRPCRT